MTVGCAAINEEDVAALMSDNPVLKHKALKKMSETNESPFAFINFWGSGENDQKAVNVMLRLLQRGKESGDVEARILRALGRLSKRCDVPVSPLIERISHHDPVVRIRAVEAVATAKAREASAVLIRQLQGNKNKYVVIWALGEIGDKGAIPALSALLNDEDEHVQYNARKALEKIEVPKQDNEANHPSLAKCFGMLEWLATTVNQEYQTAMIGVFRKIEDFRKG